MTSRFQSLIFTLFLMMLFSLCGTSARLKADSYGANLLRPSSITRYPGTNPALPDIKAMLIAAGQKYQIPPHILFGIAYQESGWREYGPDGKTLVSGDGGIGIMQLTGATAAQFDVNRLANDIAYNIDCGASVLNGKWNVTPIIGDNDRAKLENWYYAIWAYNGFVQGSTYPGTILNWIAQNPIGQWQQVTVTPPSASDIGWPAQRITNTPSPIHVDANFDGIIDGTVTTPPSVSFNEGNKNKWFGPGDLNTQIVPFNLQDTGGGVGGLSQNWDGDPGGSSPQFPGSHGGYLTFGYIPAAQRNGQHTAWVRAWNGNNSQSAAASSGWYGYDDTPPAVTITSSQTAGIIYNTPQTLTWHISESGSGIKGWGQGWDADPGSSTYTTDSGSLSLLAGTHTLHVHTMDNVGNEKDWTFGPFIYLTQVQVGQKSDGTIDQRFIDCYNRVGASVVGSVLNNSLVHTALGNGNGNGLAQDFIDGNGAKDIIIAKDGAAKAFDVSGNTWIWYSSLGFASGQAGFPTDDLNQIAATTGTAGFDTPGTSQPFEGGWVFDSKYGTHEIPQDILSSLSITTLVQINNGTFGFPTSEFVASYPSPYGTTGRQNFFERGAIYSGSGSVGTHGLTGTIFGKYAEGGKPWSGGTPSVLGFPTSDTGNVSSSFGTAGQRSQFEGGSIYSTDKYGAHPVYGDIYKQYAAAGASGGKYGFPTNDPYNWQGVTRQDFEGGYLTSSAIMQTHLLWNSANGAASIWNYDTASGTYTQNTYGPYPGWTARAIADGPDGRTRVLWATAAGQVSLWSLDNTTGGYTNHEFGPFAGWTAGSLSVGPDNTTHILWANTNGQASIWSYDTASGTYGYRNYGPFSGWSAKSLADGPDGKTRVLWATAAGQVSIWGLDSTTGLYTNHEFGPYPGWTETAMSAY